MPSQYAPAGTAVNDGTAPLSNSILGLQQISQGKKSKPTRKRKDRQPDVPKDAKQFLIRPPRFHGT